MGQTLSEPVTAKETTSLQDKRMKVASSSMQGWRINMEDAHTHILSLPNDKEASFFAVYDGHGGAKVSAYAGHHLHKRIVDSPEYKAGDYVDAIRKGFLGLDEDMLQDDDIKDEMAGTTAVCVLMRDGKMYCGNVGDSRAIISVDGVAEPLSYDHKPANEEEARRICNAGGWVEFNRVNGNLALSRALGDFIFKRNGDLTPELQIVTAMPDVRIRDVTPDIEFLLLACDGIWDVLSNQEVCDYVRDRLAVGMEPEIVCEELLTRCLAPDSQMGGLGCDNMTVVLVCLLPDGMCWETYRERCNRPRVPSPEPLDDEEDDVDDGEAGASAATGSDDDEDGHGEEHTAFVTPPHTPGHGQTDQPTTHPSPPGDAPTGHDSSAASNQSTEGAAAASSQAALSGSATADDGAPPASFDATE